MEAKEVDNFGSSHAFGGRTRGGKVWADGDVRVRVLLAEVEEALSRGQDWVLVSMAGHLHGGEIAPDAVLLHV